jgi:hypothetical protein
LSIKKTGKPKRKTAYKIRWPEERGLKTATPSKKTTTWQIQKHARWCF